VCNQSFTCALSRSNVYGRASKNSNALAPLLMLQLRYFGFGYSYSLKLGLNENNGYTTPSNAGRLGNNFMFLGFIAADLAGVQNTVEGLTVSLN